MAVRLWAKWMLSKVSRDTASGQFIAEIDGLRFIAIFSVILFHLAGYLVQKTGRTPEYDPMAKLLYQGGFGVQLFFVISGAIIALPFAKAYLTGGTPPRLRQYFTRRLTRLEPPYIVNLVVVYLLTYLFAERANNLLPHLLASMGYLHNVTYGSMSTINSVAWSLEVELQFYLLAPLLTAFFMIRSKLARRAVVVGLIAIFSWLDFVITGSPRYDLSILSHAPFFLTGFLLIDLYLTEWNQQPEKSLAWDVLSVSAWLLIVVLLFQGRTGKLLLVVPVFVAYCGAFRGLWSNRLFCQPVIYTIGGMCYTIYLYHCQIISAFGRILLKSGFFHHAPLWIGITAASLILVPIILFISTLLFIFIEKPCMKKNWHLQLMEQWKIGTKARGAYDDGMP